MCDSAESSFMQKLSYLQFKDDRANNGRLSSSSKPEAQVPVPRAVGAIESFIEPENHRTALPQNYKVYERKNIIASIRFPTPKPVEHINICMTGIKSNHRCTRTLSTILSMDRLHIHHITILLSQGVQEKVILCWRAV